MQRLLNEVMITYNQQNTSSVIILEQIFRQLPPGPKIKSDVMKRCFGTGISNNETK